MHGKSYEVEIIQILKQCDAFVIGFDETEVSKTSELNQISYKM